MSRNIVDVRTRAVVLRRTNYGEADRILNLITPEGKVSAMARGVRRARSKLAGGVEMFSLVEMNLHFGKGELATVTGARMVKYYKAILTDYQRMELMATILKKINVAADAADTAEYYKMTLECLEGLDAGLNLALVEGWLLLNLLKASGEEVNLYRDDKGEKLRADARYNYDTREAAFIEDARGRFGADEIKMLRLMVTMSLEMVARVKGVEMYLPGILWLARAASKMM